MSQSEDIGYIKADVANLKEDMREVKDSMKTLTQDAAFRSRIRKGFYYGVTLAGLIVTFKFGDIKGIFK